MFFIPDRPRKTDIQSEKNVKVGNSLTFTCNADANPAPMIYSWYRYNNDKRIDSLQWTSTTANNKLILDRVQRTDKACYVCNATNKIDSGEDSKPQCIEVLCKSFGFDGNIWQCFSKLSHRVEY